MSGETTDGTSVESTRGQGQSGRLGGARADFVASLGRKVDGCRVILKALESDPSGRALRDDLRRKLHALGAGARLLRFEALSNALAESEAILERVASVGKATPADMTALAKLFDDLPSLAWADPASRMQSPSEPPRATPHTALVVGDDDLASALVELPHSGAQFDCERTGDEQLAFELARSILPEVVLLDGDLKSSTELVEALLDDPVTEPIPIVVVVGPSSEQANRFVALGASRVLKKPIASDAIHAACTETVEQRTGKAAARVSLGDVTLDELASRLAAEVEGAILSSVHESMRKERIALGEGTEILGAIWGAIARVREVVTTRSDGQVRYAGAGPEGTLAIAPWLHPDVPAADRTRTRGAAADVRLEGRKVIVADDDPGVTWFISDLLRTNGCVVHEALDGQTALDLAYRISPDLVVSDILMPALDGFALSRAIKRDVAIRDVPIILLSWKEDLLQRVRELGVSAAAYLRKESDARAIVARVREALWSKARVEARLRAGGEARGRLDGLTVRTLLELVCAHRPNSRVSVRDACFLYEMEIREGQPRRVTRTGGDGSFERGERVFAAMLGASAGWFVVMSSEGSLQGELHGSIASQLSRPIASARGAAQALCGARTISVEKVTLDLTMMEGYLRVTPGPARQLIEQLAAGESPREMLLSGEIDPWLLEDVLVDLAVRGVVRSVKGPLGEELLGPAVEAAHAVLQGIPRRSLPPKQPSAPPAKPLRSDQVARDLGRRRFVDEDDALPSSLADAVMRELKEPSSKPPPIVAPGDLRKRGSSMPAPEEGEASEKAVPPPDKSSAKELESTDIIIDSETELDTVYEARAMTPSNPGADTVKARVADDPNDLSLPIPLVNRSVGSNPPKNQSEDDGGSSQKP
jgi:DNA-binding response OmpR family regulator